MEPTTTPDVAPATAPAAAHTAPAPRGQQAKKVTAPAKPRAPRAQTAKQKVAAEKKAAEAAAAPAPESVEVQAKTAMAHMTHRENCVMVTLGGNKVGWTSKDHRPFHFGTTEGSWEAEMVEAMVNYGIATTRTAPAVLASLKAKGLLDAGSANEDGATWWRVTSLGAAVAVALNSKTWK